MASSTAVSGHRYVRSKPYPKHKVDTLNELVEDLQRYETIMLIDLKELPNRVLKEYRYLLRGNSKIKVVKGTLIKIAMEKAYGGVSDEVAQLLRGEIGLLFTNENPFELNRFIARNGVRRFAKDGDIAQFELTIPAGNTGINPGPVLSRFGKMKVPTQIKDGKIWVAKDTVVAKAGDKISADLADILRLLNIKPVFESIRIKAAIVRGKYVIRGEELMPNAEEYRKLIEASAAQAYNLAVNAVYPLPELMPVYIRKAVAESINLAVNALIFTEESAAPILAKAEAQANALASAIASKAPELGIQVSTPQQAQPANPATEEKKEEAEEKKEEKGEEEALGGLSSLFG
ncbi:50S ribosomal protein L10 [Thermocladium modestius]|uniref:Large ribosomal subunit protein uL10 n=1 Tax=Thermocladium modestius TaxID=62609 RepID=A0A830GVP3_9CREN|nr:50S ribosomal protein L10 [Thermocladium modestius]GGP20510.1 50S ribosomal protein L10 [Thermocladium modestius]